MTSVRLTGNKELKDALRRLGVNADKELADAVRMTAQGIRGNAQKLIARGTKSGAVYDKTNPRRRHRASAAGEAPATDTGRLVGSIRADVAGKEANVSANTVYAAPLEFGTRDIAPRPFMVPALESERPSWERRLREAVTKATRRAGR
jgi:HK97 gp10 family phage protein